MPYHDWLTENEANEIIQKLESSPPCLLIIDKQSTSIEGRNSPFDAYPMRKIEEFLKGGFLKKYIEVDTLQAYSGKHIVFRKMN